jgi:glycosyltransferase involved in cell wall biosynthesis
MTILWQRARIPLPMGLFTGPADILHGPDFALAPAPGMRRIATIHDVAYLTAPEVVAPKNVAYLSSVVRRTVASADHIITDSQCSANDVVRLLGMPQERVTAIHLGIEPRFTPEQDPARKADLVARYALKHPFILAVGTIEPRKRYDALIAAFARARTQPGGPRMLAIAGPKGWRADETLAAVRAHDVADVVRFLDFVADTDLPALYRAADVLAMPARYEGFGFPVVEAMACGTPVVASNTGSLPEVVGDAGLMVDVAADGALADALARATSDADLRSELVHRGIERAATFTWERTAGQTLDVYRAVSSRPRRKGNT